MKPLAKNQVLRFSTRLFLSLVIISVFLITSLQLSPSAQAATLYRISGVIWADDNANGVLDEGEQGISNVIMELYDRYGALLATTLTASAPNSGAYFFDVEYGKYTVAVAEANYAPGGVLEGYTPTVDYDGNGEGEDWCTQWVSKDDDSYNFGFDHPKADLSITKDDGVEEVEANSATTYTIRVLNGGPDAAAGAVLTDEVGEGLTATSVVCSASADNLCADAPLLDELIAGGISLPNLAPGEFYEIEMSATVTAETGSVTNSVTVTPPAEVIDPNLTNNTASDTDTLPTTQIPTADLSVTKDDGVELVNSNDVVTYTIRVLNGGPDAADGAVLTDEVGEGLAATGVACSVSAENLCTAAPVLADLTAAGITLPSLAPGEFYEIELSATVTAQTGWVTNLVTVAPPAGVIDPDLTNNAASDTDTLLTNLPIDLGVTKTDDVYLLDPGSITVYTIRVTNLGLGTVSGARLVDDSGLYVTPMNVLCSDAPDNLCIDPPLLADLTSTGIILPTISPGQFYEIWLTSRLATIPCAAINTVIVTLTGYEDADLSNNRAQDTDFVLLPPPPTADLVLTKSNGVSVLQPNSNTTYTLRVLNKGPEIISDVNLDDILGNGLTAVSVVCSAAPGNLCFTDPLLATLISTGINLPALEPGQFYEIELTANVTIDSGAVINKAELAIPLGYFDPNPSDNSVSDIDEVIAGAPFRVEGVLHQAFLPLALHP